MKPKYLEQHSQMVTDLAKPGEAILETLNVGKTHLVHMLLGLAGEGYELQEAISNQDVPNTLEELGDCHFYIEGIAQFLNLDVSQFEENAYTYAPIVQLMVATGNVVDTGKKLVIYNQPSRTEALALALRELWKQLRAFETFMGYSLEDVLEANRRKLLTNDNARYKDGTYTDEAAAARADKAE